MININIDNIDEYYEIVNNKIDEFFKYNIDPKSLKRYLKRGTSGMNRFIEKSKLDDVKNIEKVIEDVVDDRIAKKELEITTFENFTPDDFVIEFNIDENVHKIIADLYKVSLGHLIVDNNHIKLTRVKSAKELFVYNMDQLDTIFNQICNKIYNQIKNDIISFDLLDLDIILTDKIEEKYFKLKTFESIKGNYIIVQKILSIKTGNYFQVKEITDHGLVIFEKIS